MKRILLLAVILCNFCLICQAQVQASFSSYHAGKRYDFNITAELLAKTPAWPEDQENPPLAARQALKIATAYLQKLFPDAEKWTNHGLQLVPIGEKWVYLVEFSEPPLEGVVDYSSSPFRILVLMNGETVEAKVSLWKFSEQGDEPDAQ